jgi:hypothetical protein
MIAFHYLISYVLIFMIFMIFCFSSSQSLSTTTSIKIVDGIEKLYDNTASVSTPSHGLNHNSDIEYYPPKNSFNGPENLVFLSKRCFLDSFDRWEYQICPFHNITQRRVMSHGGPATLLGVWGYWNTYEGKVNITRAFSDGEQIIEERKAFTSMEYIDGPVCPGFEEKGEPLTSTTLILRCGLQYDSWKILTSENVKNDKICQYKIELATPLPCAVFLSEDYDKLV